MKTVLSICYLLVALTKLSCAQTATQTDIVKLNNLKDLVSQSSLVIEGRTIKSKGFMQTDGKIFTSDIIKISKIFKGNISDSVIEVIFRGGSANGIIAVSDAGLCMGAGEEGIFFLKDNKFDSAQYKDLQSFVPAFFSGCFIEYFDKPHQKIAHNHVAINGTFAYDDLEKDLFEPIEAITGEPPKILGLNMFERTAAANKAKH